MNSKNNFNDKNLEFKLKIKLIKNYGLLYCQYYCWL